MKIAVIAHDGKKKEFVEFLMENKDYLKNIDLIATKVTGDQIENAGLSVTKVESGANGGDAQLAGMVVEKKIDMVIFFRDPMGKHVQEPDIQTLMRVCDVHDVPLATNLATVKLLLKGITAKNKGISKLFR